MIFDHLIDYVDTTLCIKVEAPIPDGVPFLEPTRILEIVSKTVGSSKTLLKEENELFLDCCMYKMDGLGDVVATILW